ncbi:MAG: hypothetical protein E7004_01100 [Alphaproteobacteria bacterium]|nr:hypothetical protein [Alphaproteobacteria bacterium]
MKRILAIVLLCMVGVFVAVAQEATVESDKSSDSLPRFVSLRSETVNARSGPGTKYPIDWVYMQKSAPVEIIAEFENWRRIRDWQGSESWVLVQLLSRKRFVKVITPGENNLYAKDNLKSKIIARIEDDVIGEIKKCPADNTFCLIAFNNFEGWMPRQNLYGIYPDEIID